MQSNGALSQEGDKGMNSTFWQAEQLRAGQVYSTMLFPSETEAKQFVRHMEQQQPDIFWRLRAVAANAIWN